MLLMESLPISCEQDTQSPIGATLVGLEIILFFAYNWGDIPKFLKPTVVFSRLIPSHGGALWIQNVL